LSGLAVDPVGIFTQRSVVEASFENVGTVSVVLVILSVDAVAHR